jgi:hypothetical protein
MKGILVAAIFLIATTMRGETCTLQTYASSWRVTGTAFSVKCASGVYSGTLVSTPAKRFFRRGHLFIKFDQPLVVHTKKATDEARIKTDAAASSRACSLRAVWALERRT